MCNLCKVGMSETEKNVEEEEIFKVLMTENCPKSMADTYAQMDRCPSRHIIFQLLGAKGKKKILT